MQPGPHLLQAELCVLLQTGDGAYTEIASIYDTATNTFVPFHMPDAAFCGAQTILPDGRAIIVGGELLLLACMPRTKCFGGCCCSAELLTSHQLGYDDDCKPCKF